MPDHAQSEQVSGSSPLAGSPFCPYPSRILGAGDTAGWWARFLLRVTRVSRRKSSGNRRVMPTNTGSLASRRFLMPTLGHEPTGKRPDVPPRARLWREEKRLSKMHSFSRGKRLVSGKSMLLAKAVEAVVVLTGCAGQEDRTAP